jgi:hypothetical protein
VVAGVLQSRPRGYKAPVNSTKPAISGTPAVGANLTSTNGSWTNDPTSYSYQWQDCANGSCANISGATSSTYAVRTSDAGDATRVIVTATNSYGSTTADSAQTAVIPTPGSAPTNTSAPTITGTATVGNTLTAGNGSWSGSPTSYSYQWQDCANGSCTNISGATSSTYTIQTSDENNTIKLLVTATNSYGSTTAGSAQTAVIPTPAQGATISPSPAGPSAPSGGWSVAYGDAYNEQICGSQGTAVGGPGCDNTLYPNRNARTCGDLPGYNSDEMEQFNCSQVSVASNGLDLACTYTDGLTTPQGDAPSHYLCGTVQGQDTQVPTGDKFFTWKPGQGQEWAVQAVVQFPPNTGEADPGWWSSDWAWSEEIDFIEGFGLQAGKDGTWCNNTISGGTSGFIGTTMPTWIYNTSTGGMLQAESSICRDLGFDPASGFHTYTTVFYPNNTFSEYVDGKLDDWSFVPEGGSSYTNGGSLAGPPSSLSNATMGLILSYGLRDDNTGDPDPYFPSGTRNMYVRSVAVYENASANGANEWNGGLAPGTTVSAG